jgi:hypothetical protein
MTEYKARVLGAGLVRWAAGGLLAAGSLGAQQGRTSVLVAGVADAETGQALEGAEVLLPDQRRLARTNGLGEAHIDGVPRGTRRVRVRKIGYAPAEVDLAFAGDTTGAVFRLPRTAVQLGAVNVEAAWVPPKMRDVERRQRRGIGRFLAADVLDKERDRDFGVLVSSRFPGLRLVTQPTGGGQQLVSTRGGGIGSSACVVQVYVDDIAYQPADDVGFIRTWDLAAVEYYAANEVPIEYRTRRYACGVLLVWSKWY